MTPAPDTCRVEQREQRSAGVLVLRAWREDRDGFRARLIATRRLDDPSEVLQRAFADTEAVVDAVREWLATFE